MIKYKYRFIVYLILLFILMSFLFVVACIVFAQKTPQEAFYGFTDTSYIAPRMPYYPQPETFGVLIEELIECESGGNPNALGDEGKAKGVLQFHEPTFQRFCVDRYKYRDDIWDEEIQRECCAEMIEENFDNVYHWTCFGK